MKFYHKIRELCLLLMFNVLQCIERENVHNLTKDRRKALKKQLVLCKLECKIPLTNSRQSNVNWSVRLLLLTHVNLM